MTNVQTSRRHSCCRLLQALCLVAAFNASTPAAEAQGVFDQFGSSNSGSSAGASELLDVNRRSFGVNTRIGHVTGNSVGRIDPVTYLNVAPYFNFGPTAFIFDLQMGRANEGGLTGHAGGVFRTFVEEWDVVTGISAHHSRDDISGALFRTWGLGVDIMSDTWEARANYVRPNGTTSRIANQRIDETTAAFSGNSIIFDRIDTVAEALEGFDVEVGSLLFADAEDRFKLRGFMGAYRYFSPAVPHFTGWKTHVQADVMKRLELDLALTEDTQFKTTVSFNAVVHFGGFKADDYTSKSAIHRLADPVRRNLSVPTVQGNVVVPGIEAINPVDGLPYQVVHVDENDTVGPFTGTVEAPLMSLTAGLGVPDTDIVFVHAGGVYDTAPDNMITVGPGQRVFGEGLISAVTGDRIVDSTIPVLDLGDLTLPSSPVFSASGGTLARPTLSGAAGDAVTLLEGSQFGGFVVSGAAGAGITSDDMGDTRVHDTLVENTTGAGIFLQNTTGVTTIVNTIISGAVGPAFHVDGGTGSIGYGTTSVDLDPSFSNILNSSQQAVLIENMTAAGQVSMLGTTITDTGGTGIDILNNDGNATIDNVTVTSSTATGIRVLNSNGNYVFRDTVRANTLITGATQESILIDGLGATGTVTFESVIINGRNDAGINITNNSGSVEFLNDVSMGLPNAGAEAGVSVSNAQATSVVSFDSGLSITGSSGRGIELLNNLDGSQFNTAGTTSISLTLGESIFMTGQSGVVLFDGTVGITDRLERGISIQSSDGTIAFAGGASIDNIDEMVFVNRTPAVDIQDSEATVLFSALTIANALGDPAIPTTAGVHMANNLAGATNTALINLGTVDIVGQDGPGIFGLNNTSITVARGTIEMLNGAAVDIEESGWDIMLDQVQSDGSDFGIRLVNAAPPVDNSFIAGATEDTIGGAGGSLLNHAVASAIFTNAGEVRLRGIDFVGAPTGILLRNSGLDEDDDQILELRQAQFESMADRSVDAQNLLTLSVFNSNFQTPGLSESILLTYNETLNDIDTTVFTAFDNPYEVFIEQTVFENDVNDNVRIFAEAGAADAHLDVSVFNNVVNMLGDDFLIDQTAFEVDWNGPNRVLFSGNAVAMAGIDTTDTQIGFDIRNRSTTDEMLLSIVTNQLTSSDIGAIGIDIETAGPSDMLIENNLFTFSETGSTGARFDTAPDTELFLTNNLFRFEEDGGTGFRFTELNQPTAIAINGNVVQLFDDAGGIESGFLATFLNGTINLSGNVNNIVELINPGDATALIENPFTFAGNTNGTFIGNGAFVP